MSGIASLSMYISVPHMSTVLLCKWISVSIVLEYIYEFACFRVINGRVTFCNSIDGQRGCAQTHFFLYVVHIQCVDGWVGESVCVCVDVHV